MHSCPICEQTCDCDGDDMWLHTPEDCTCCSEAWDYAEDEDEEDYWEAYWDENDHAPPEIPYAACVHGWQGLWLKIQDCIHGNVHGTYNRLLWKPWPVFFEGVQQAEISHFSRAWCNAWMLSPGNEFPF